MNCLERLLEEREQLQDRIDELRIFLDKETKEATVTTEADRRLLALQWPFMEEYKKVLDNRIYIAENKKGNEEAMKDKEIGGLISEDEVLKEELDLMRTGVRELRFKAIAMSRILKESNIDFTYIVHPDTKEITYTYLKKGE